MGRRRTTDKHLPQRVYRRGRSYYFVDRAGKWHRLGRAYDEALRALATILGHDSQTNTVSWLIDNYVAEELGKKAQRTRRGRLQEFKPLRKAFGRMQPEQIEPHHVWSYWKARGETEQARHEVRALSALLTYARRMGYRTRENPCFGLRLPGAKPRDRYVTDDEFLALRELAPAMIGYAMDLALLCGFDGATVRMLERRHVTEEGIEFERPKTGEPQIIEWNEELRATVKALLSERPQLRRFLICNRRGDAYTLNGFASQWQRVMKRAKKKGLPTFHFHDLRAKSASDADSDQSAADRLGHADVKLTRRIYRRLPRRATALRILDALTISDKGPEK